MIEFAPITLATKSIFSKYVSTQIRNCNAAFANIFCWQQSYHSLWAEAEGFLVVKYRVEGSSDTAYMLLTRQFTDENLAAIVPLLEEDARIDGQQLRISSLPAYATDIMRSLFGEKFAYAANRDTADYIYNASELRELPGRKYQPKRNHLNRFNDFYNWQFEPLSAEHKEECLRLESEWQSHHRNDETAAAERSAIVCAFDNFDALGLSGGILHIDGRLAAFTYGSPVNDEVFDIHVEKADTAYEGIFPAINRLFAQTIPQQYKFINREEDMGLEGLRRAKLSYHPASLEDKYTALALTECEIAVSRLWSSVFGDERRFTDKFLVDRKLCQIRSYVIKDGSDAVSMAHLVPLTNAAGCRFAYIYGVATDPSYRNRGYASLLLAEVLEVARRSFDAAILIPSGSDAKRLYSGFGFEDAEIPVTFTTEFDFGSGNPQDDLAMILKFNDAALAETTPLQLSSLTNSDMRPAEKEDIFVVATEQ